MLYSILPCVVKYLFLCNYVTSFTQSQSIPSQTPQTAEHLRNCQSSEDIQEYEFPYAISTTSKQFLNREMTDNTGKCGLYTRPTYKST